MNDLYQMDVESDPAKLKSLQEALTEYVEMVEQRDTLDSLLSETKQKIRKLQDVTIPEMMNDAGVDLVGVKDKGVDVRLDMYCKAAIPKGWSPEKKTKAFDHLRELGGEDLIKTEISVKSGRGNAESMRRMYERIQQMAAEYEIDVSTGIDDGVQWNSLSSFVKTAMENGDPVDLELLGAHYGETAKIVSKE